VYEEMEKDVAILDFFLKVKAHEVLLRE